MESGDDFSSYHYGDFMLDDNQTALAYVVLKLCLTTSDYQF